MLRGRNCSTLGAHGALIYIFLSPARSSQNNLALSTTDPGSASARLEKTYTKTLPGAHSGQGLGAHSDLLPSLLLSLFLSSFSFSASLQSSHFFLSRPLFSHSLLLFPLAFFLLLTFPVSSPLSLSPDPLFLSPSCVSPPLCSPCRLSAFPLLMLKQGGSLASGDAP